jgi:hypothetical protein
MMLNSWKNYELELRYFDLIQSETATFEEIKKYIDANTVSSTMERMHFIFKILTAKLLNGNFFRIIQDLRLLHLLIPKN